MKMMIQSIVQRKSQQTHVRSITISVATMEKMPSANPTARSQPNKRPSGKQPTQHTLL